MQIRFKNVNKVAALFCFFAWVLTTKVSAACMSAAVIQSKPIGYLDSEGVGRGVHWDFLQAISDETGLCIDNELLPFARVWRSLEVGRHDLAVGFASSERDDKVLKVALIRELRTIVVGSQDINIHHYDDLVGLRIGKTRSTKLNKDFDRDTRLDIIELNDYEQAVTMLMAGRIDALAGSEKAIRYQTEKAGYKHYLIRNGFFVLGIKQQWLHMSKHSPFQAHIPQLMDAVDTLNQTGVFPTLVSKHYFKH